VGLVGDKELVIKNGRVVTDRHGKEVSIHKRSIAALLSLAEKYLPEYAAQPKQVEITHNTATTNGIPSNYALVIDTRLLSAEQFAILRTIATDLDKKRGIIDSTSSQL